MCSDIGDVCAGKSAAFLPWIASTVSALELASLLGPPPSLAGEALPVEFLSSFLVSFRHHSCMLR